MQRPSSPLTQERAADPLRASVKRIARLLPAGWSPVAPPPSSVSTPGSTMAGCTVDVFPTQLPAGIATTPLSLAVKDLTFVDAGLRAAEAGFDALFVDTVCDYGLPELRSCVSLPVYGAGESAVLAGIASGQPFALVTVWATASRPLFDRVLARTGDGGRCIGVRHVFDEDAIGSLGGAEAVAGGIKSKRGAVLSEIVRTCRDAIEDGARAIVLGCTCMSPAAGALVDQLGVPVVDPLAAGLRDTVAALAGGASGSGTLPSAWRPSTLVEQAQVRRMISALADVAEAPEAESCPVCVA
jgi:allantoin racemase